MSGVRGGGDKPLEEQRIGISAEARVALLAARHKSLGVHSPAVDLLNSGNRCGAGVSGSCELTLHRDAPEEPILPASDLDHDLAVIRERDAQNSRKVPELELRLSDTASQG